MAILLRAGTVRHWNLPNQFICSGCQETFKNRYPTHVLVNGDFRLYYHSLKCAKSCGHS